MEQKLELAKLTDNIYGLGHGVWLKKQKTLVVGDFHMGYEEYLASQGVLAPRELCRLTKELLLGMLQVVTPQVIVINGDLKHEFGEISAQEWRDTLQIFDLLIKHCKKLVLVKGNHDNILGPIARKRNLEVVDYYIIDEIAITHGHRQWKNEKFLGAKTLIVNHKHPAIRISEGVKRETYKCFVLGAYKGKKLLVLPSFLPIIPGKDISTGNSKALYWPKSFDNFEVFVIGDKIYPFGKLKNIK